MQNITNPDYFAKVYDEHGNAIFRYILFRVYDRDVALDLMQDTFMRTWEYITSGKSIDNVRAFLYRVARNLVIDRSRKKPTTSLDEMKEHGTEPHHLPHEALRTKLDTEVALKHIAAMDEHYREAVTLRYVEGFSPKEIAALIEETENVVSVRIHRGLKQLRKQIKA